jgi:ComF family protein
VSEHDESRSSHQKKYVHSSVRQSLLPYRNPLIQAAIIEAKFHDARAAQVALGAVLAIYLRPLVQKDSFLGRHVLIPIPLSKERQRSRGYNQVERVCSIAAQRLGTPIEVEGSLLVRTRDTSPQTSLGGAARHQNLIGAFQLSSTPDPDATYILVDDVLTTGSTLTAALVAFKSAGIERIIPIALAH